MKKLEVWKKRCPENVRPGCEPKYIENENNKRAIVLLHGLTDSPYFMEAIGKRFAQLDFNVYIPLLPGHGLKDPQGMRGVTLKSWQDEVDQVVAHAKKKDKQVSIGGLSTGGTLSVWKANQNPSEIDGGVFLFSAALDIADDDDDNPFKKGDFKERLLRLYCIRKPLAIIQDLTTEPLVGNDPGDNPYRYSRMDYDGAAQLAECIKQVEKAKLKQSLFVAHSEADEAADILGVEELMMNHQGKREQIYYYRIGKTLGVPHASVVLEHDVLSHNGLPLEPKNPYFNEMMNRVTLFINQKLSTVSAPATYNYKPQVEALKDIFFDYYKGTYSPGIAHWLAYCSEVVYYRQKDDKEKKVFKPKKTHHTKKFPHEELILSKLQGLDSDFIAVKGFENNSSQAIIIHHKNYLVISFRGTDEIADWIDNINFGRDLPFKDLETGFKKSFGKWLGHKDSFSTNQLFGRVHQGFYRAFLDVWDVDGMWKELEQLIDDTNLPLWITGHSLGGAMATFAAAWMVEQNLSIRGVYTFGQPRCGDKDFSLQLNAKLPNKFFRFHNSNDIVPRLPARLMNFEHAGKLVYITDDLKLDANPAKWDRFLEGVRGIVEDVLDSNFVPDGIEDHNIVEGYIKGISFWQDRKPENW